MIESQIRIVGAVVFWRLGERTGRRQLAAAWEAAGFGAFTPEQRPNTAALKDALAAVYQRRTGTFRVERMGDSDSFEVVEVRRGQFKVGNTYGRVLEAKIDPDPASPHIKFHPFGPGCQEIVDEFNGQLGLLAPGQVSGAMVRVLMSMGGTVLRPTGGVYWLPDGSLDRWAEAAAAVEGSGNNFAYLLRTSKDAESVRAVRDAVVAECLAEAKRLEAEIAELIGGESAIASEGGRKRRQSTIKKRMAEFADIARKLGAYEELLGVGLESVREAVERCEVAACTATMLDSADVGEEVTA